ncbi:MAG TPA: ATP-binding protein [Solirubrobacteraceae bacterium]|nr:ATP-binding protein [Solirubrobacteraceae bacterium]
MTAPDSTKKKMANNANGHDDPSGSGRTHAAALVELPSQASLRGEVPPSGRGETRVRALPAELRRLERLFDEIDWPDRRAFLKARRHARKRALETLSVDAAASAMRTALLVASAELFARMRSELTAAPRDAARLADQLEDVMGVSRLALAREVLRAPELLTVSPAAALDAQLGMLTALAPVRSVSLWTLDDAEQIQCARHVGEGNPSRGARQLATQLFAGQSADAGARRLLVGLPVGRWRHPLAALVGSARPGMRDACESFLLEAVSMLAAILERDALLGANTSTERTLVESSERKLTRLGFDLHDGPIQDVAVVASDLRALRDELEAMLADAGARKLVRRRVDEVESQLLSLDVDLRRISNEVRAASVLLNRPFARALRDVAQAFAARTNTEPRVELDGELGQLSASQQIALLNIVHEALANVREHSDAKKVQIAVSANAEGVEAQVIDDGQGFDLESTLIRAAREGRLGLVAMHERVRLLGGQCRIDSRPGGPTVVSVALERWEPVGNEAQANTA